ncbi:22731_t:CDS:2 [Gigaspora margarita]|uniref:22731_t:CDS:1 n=1 Tax=Gigaspora margarita TaxID=4874 RepID=A0ABN7USH9_GIGMA|nr:22731_t:CDS:2 [Gigaspora margarita]
MSINLLKKLSQDYKNLVENSEFTNILIQIGESKYGDKIEPRKIEKGDDFSEGCLQLALILDSTQQSQNLKCLY